MTIKSKVFAAVATITLAGSLSAAGVTATWASSAGCAFTNGCATLHGTDAASHAVAMDAKYQNPKEIVIGYPDIPGDGATSFDSVLHYTTGAKTTTYQDTGLQVSDLHLACSGPGSTPVVGVNAVTAGDPLTVQNANGTNFTANGPATSLPFTGSVKIGTVLDETYGTGCVLAYTATSPTTFALTPFPAPITLSYPGGSVTKFNDTDTPGTFSFSGLPSGISASGGSLTADTSTAVPGTYTSVSVTFTNTGSGSEITEAFKLVVSGIKSVNPGNHIPYYTFAYAKGGTWTNQCVTDNGGSGALRLETCTLGKDQYQDFYAETVPGGSGAPVLLGGGSYYIQNRIAAVTSPASSCLTDGSILNPSTPQSDATDEAIGGRQLRVDGSCSSAQDQWSWAS